MYPRPTREPHGPSTETRGEYTVEHLPEYLRRYYDRHVTVVVTVRSYLGLRRLQHMVAELGGRTEQLGVAFCDSDGRLYELVKRAEGRRPVVRLVRNPRLRLSWDTVQTLSRAALTT